MRVLAPPLLAAALAGCGGGVAEAKRELHVGAAAESAKSAAGSAAQAPAGKDAAKAKPDVPAAPAAERFRTMAERRLAQPAQQVPVATARVERGFIADYYRGATNLTAADEAVVVARTLGVVESIFVEEGDVVRAGQRLAQLETERLELELKRSRTQLENLQAAYERASRLHEERMISPNEYDTARFNYRSEQANLALREYDLREAAIRATIDGVITRRHVKVGHTLNPGGVAFEMKSLQDIEAVLNVSEREMQRVRAGQLARLSVDALPGRQFVGAVSRVAPEVDPATGTFRVTVSLANADGRLKPGMFARVEVRVDERQDALLAPLETVVVLRDRSSVFVVEEGVAARRPVTTGYVSDGVIELLDGADEGDEVVSTGQEGLRDGTPVRVVASHSPDGSSRGTPES